jgi:hypothetical protein
MFQFSFYSPLFVCSIFLVKAFRNGATLVRPHTEAAFHTLIPNHQLSGVGGCSLFPAPRRSRLIGRAPVRPPAVPSRPSLRAPKGARSNPAGVAAFRVKTTQSVPTSCLRRLNESVGCQQLQGQNVAVCLFPTGFCYYA